MQHIVTLLLLDSALLPWQSYMRFALTCQATYKASAKKRATYKMVVQVVEFLKLKHEYWSQYSHLWRHDGAVCTFPLSYWAPILPMTPLQYALYFATLMTLFDCQGARVIDGVVEWLAVVHPSPFCIKHLPSYHGYIYMHGADSDISFPAFTNVHVDAVLVTFRVDVHKSSGAALKVSVHDYLTPAEPRLDEERLCAHIDTRALDSFLRHSARLLDRHAVLDVIDAHPWMK